MPKQELEKITNKHLILCEGADERGFLNNYLYSQAANQYREIQVVNFGGNQELRNFLALLRVTDGFADLCTLLVIRDAETDAQNASVQIRSALEKNNFAVPKRQGEWAEGVPRTCFLLFPYLGKNAEPGTLEDLCLSILADREADNVIGRIDAFLGALQQENLRKISHPHKTRLHTYFSITNDFVTKNIGLAAKAGAFNWNHPNLDSLKECLSKMEEE